MNYLTKVYYNLKSKKVFNKNHVLQVFSLDIDKYKDISIKKVINIYKYVDINGIILIYIVMEKSEI